VVKHVAKSCKFIKYLIKKKVVLDYTLLYYLINLIFTLIKP